jgi:hypothetical protein
LTIPPSVPRSSERGGSVGAPTEVDSRSGACPSTGERDDGMGVENPPVDGEMSTAVSERSRGGTPAMPTIDGDGRSSDNGPGREGPDRGRRSSAACASASNSTSDRVTRSSEIAAVLSSASRSRASSSCSSGPPASAPRCRTRRLANRCTSDALADYRWRSSTTVSDSRTRRSASSEATGRGEGAWDSVTERSIGDGDSELTVTPDGLELSG